MLYDIQLSRRASSDLGGLRAFDRSKAVDVMLRMLGDEPDVQTRNRRRLRRSPGEASEHEFWECRAGMLRVFYTINEVERVVRVAQVSLKLPGDRTEDLFDADRDD